MTQGRQMALQVAIGIATAIAASVISALLLDSIRARRDRAALPQPVAPGAGTA